MGTDPILSAGAAVGAFPLDAVELPATSETSASETSDVQDVAQEQALVEQASEKLLSFYLLQTFSMMSEETQRIRQDAERMLHEMQEE